ncbi:hypothetical protein BC830DRAFT_169374 [Chytriomyces sp. MP71]|nr:hypothetical protein BC830DRAFT_169374 [Chytriomyces sp. MP71]
MAETEVKAPAKKQKVEEDNDETKTIFVGNLSFNADEDSIAEFFAECGEVVGVRIISGPDGKKKGFGYVEFSTSEAAKKGVEMAGSELDGRAIRCDLSTPKPARRDEKPASAPADTLFVGNMSFNATEEGLREVFSEHGEVTSVRIPTDRETGNPKGFGYVSFSSVEGAKVALEALNGFEFEGRGLRLDFSQPRTESGFGGGRGGGRGGFGGDRGGRGGGRGGRGGFGGGRGGFGGDRGGRGGARGGRGGFGGGRGGFSAQPAGKKTTFD